MNLVGNRKLICLIRMAGAAGYFVLRRISWKQMTNHILNSFALMTRRTYVYGYPTDMRIELSGACNLKCKECFTGQESLAKNKTIMPFEKAKVIIDEISPYVITLCVSGWGESMMNPEIYKIIAYAKQKGIRKVYFHSNLTLLNTRQKAMEMISSGLDCLVVSLDGTTSEAHEQYRGVRCLDQIIENMQLLIATKKELAAVNPQIEMQFMVVRHNEHQKKDFLKLGKELGVDRVVFKSINLDQGHLGYVDPKDIAEWLPDDQKYRRYVFHNGRWIRKGIHYDCCDVILNYGYIDCNGDVLRCATDYGQRGNLGNVFQAGSFKKVWNSKEFQDLRRAVNYGNKKETAYCKGCEGADYFSRDFKDANAKETY